MKKGLFLFTFISLFSITLMAQTAFESVRYSYSNIHGSARNIALGGANTALGGELSSLHFNPAGIGMFYKPEISATGGLFIKGVTTNHYGNEVYNSTPGLALSNLNYISNIDLNKGKWKSVSAGLSYSQTASFDETFIIEGP